ncbi:MAG: hypothetical protein ACE5EI_01790 [Thermodesulfobacteriota bacterium]
MEWIWWIFILVVAAILPAYMASTKGRNFLLWWLYAAVLFPVAFVHVLTLGFFGGRKQCGYCRTMVSSLASHCPRCGYEFTDSTGGERQL